LQKNCNIVWSIQITILSQTGCSCGTEVECSAANSKIKGLSLAAACTEREKTAKKFCKKLDPICAKNCNIVWSIQITTFEPNWLQLWHSDRILSYKFQDQGFVSSRCLHWEGENNKKVLWNLILFVQKILYKSQLLFQMACGGSIVVEHSAKNPKIEGWSPATSCTEREKTAKKFDKTWTNFAKKLQHCLVYTNHNFWVKQTMALAQC